VTGNNINHQITDDHSMANSQRRLDLFRHYLFLFSISGALIALDQWTKYLVRNSLEFGEMWTPWYWLSPYARIVHWQNSGAAFGMFQSGGQIFAVLAVIVSIMIIYYFPQVPRSDTVLRFAMTLQLAGAVGNLIDRIHQGYVTDFISIGTFPVFNVADSSITTGVGVLLLAIWIAEQQEKVKRKSGEEMLEVNEGREETATGD